MKYYTFALLLLASLILIISCQEDDDVTTQNPPNGEDTLTIKKVNVNGFIQKGPFINGTAVTISELDDSLVATGKNFNTQIADNKGSFEIRNIELTSDYVQLTANGFYFDEIKGEKSAAQLTLFALANISNASSINVNILSHLEKDRAHFLIRQGKSFAEAKKQAQQEILAIFNIAKENIGNSETLDISQEGDDNAILLAISTILQGHNTVAELSELLANINTDIKEDGELNSNSSREKLVSNAKSLDLAAIREHIEKRYDELGVTSTIPNFEKYIDSDGDGILNGDEDDTPDEFTFDPQIDVAISQSVISNEITILGIKEGGKADIYVTNGAFIINGQEVTDTVTQVANGDKVKIITTSGNEYNTIIKAKVTVGSLVKFFEIITDDYIPDDFVFSPKENVAIDSIVVSETITLSGIPYPTPASISDGIIIKNGVELETDTTSLKEGDQVAIKLLSSKNFSTSTSATLNVNGVEGTFEVTTDDYAPDAFSFMPVENAKRDTVYTSNTITVSGLLYPTPINIDNGILIINEIELEDNQASIVSGDKIAIKASSSSEFSEKTMAILQIGSVIKAFEITTQPDPWEKLSDYPGLAVSSIAGFTINGKIYAGTGHNPGFDYYSEFYEFDPTTNSWAKKADFAGASRRGAISFSIAGKGYIGMGEASGIIFKNFWKYDPLTNGWTQVANFSGGARTGAVSFTIGDKAYVGLGQSQDETYYKDFWEYNPNTDSWKQIADFGGVGRIYAWAFTAENKGIVGTGFNKEDGSLADVWKYDPVTDSWTKQNDCICSSADRSKAFTVGNKAYLNKVYDIPDLYQYNVANDSWHLVEGKMPIYAESTFSTDENGYILADYGEFWKFTPPKP